MKYIIAALIFIVSIGESQAQNSYGNIYFERTTDWIEIMTELPYMTQEDIDRDKLTWGKNSSWTENYRMYFTPESTIYTYGENVNEDGYSWRKRSYVLKYDINKNKDDNWIELFGKNYIIREEATKYKWKVLNEIKEVAGFLCMKAETVDTVKNQTIHAWFTNEIPVSSGPEGYHGLPGMILEIEINGGSAIITATKVDFESQDDKPVLPKKMKGKEITRAEFQAKLQKYIDESIEGKRNPFWQIRY